MSHLSSSALDSSRKPTWKKHLRLPTVPSPQPMGCSQAENCGVIKAGRVWELKVVGGSDIGEDLAELQQQVKE